MEPVRPKVDAFVLDWIRRTPLKREWFFEQRDGNCRLMSDFTTRLSETAPMWARAVAPIAESAARLLWLTTPESNRHTAPATRLTQSRKREAKGVQFSGTAQATISPGNFCQECGAPISKQNRHCITCTAKTLKQKMAQIAAMGREAAQSPEARAKVSETQKRQCAARKGWLASSLPTWLNNEAYLERIQPRLTGISQSAIASALGVCLPYAADIRAGRRLPHPRHWLTLAGLVGSSLEDK